MRGSLETKSQTGPIINNKKNKTIIYLLEFLEINWTLRNLSEYV